MSITLLPDFVTEQEARELVEALPEKPPEALYHKIADTLERYDAGRFWRRDKSRASLRIECLPAGHPWHFDGCATPPLLGWEPGRALRAIAAEKLKPGGYPWSRLSVSLLLGNPESFDGGELELLTAAGEVVTLSPRFAWRTLICWVSGLETGPLTTPVLHRVLPHRARPGFERLGWSHNSEGKAVKQWGGTRHALLGFFA